MSIPKWKKLLSYFTDVHIDSVQSPINEVVHLSLNRGRMMLSTNNAIYSYDDLYLNYQYAIRNWKFDPEIEYKVLILGFGLGSAAYILEQHKIPIKHITAIEYDPAVIELASTYSLPRFSTHIDLIEADAAIWLALNEEKYDLIVMDIFVDVTTPEFFRSKEFTHALADHLSDDGTLMYNFLAQNETDISLARQYFNSTFKNYFPDAGMMKVYYNLMLINDKQQFNNEFPWL